MMLSYCIMGVVSQINNVGRVFMPYEAQQIDCSLQKMAYLALCFASLGYVLWQMSGMGLLPTASGDWISKIEYIKVRERIF
jgi:hypothetical protein